MLYGNETWALRDIFIQRLKCTEMRIQHLTVMAGCVRVSNYKLRDRMDLEYINVVMQRGRLRWFGHVERMGHGNWVKRVRRDEKWRWKGEERKGERRKVQ